MRLRIATFMWLMAFACSAVGCQDEGSRWDDWNDFAERFVQADGRIIDWTFEQKSTSEGQSYALFFALVANDRPRFDAILNWTNLNLANGELGNQLPGWHWGKRDDGSWGIKDSNPAADGDLWIAYSLLEAARLWKAPIYEPIARKLLAQIARQETRQAGAAGTVLLPGPTGFELGDGRYRTDPSYIPPFQFRYLGTIDPKGPWFPILDGYMRLSPKIFAKGVAPDLVVVNDQGEVLPDIERKHASYDAIRVYLWAAMSGRDGLEQLQLLRPFVNIIRDQGVPPEKVETATAQAVPSDWSPNGFMAAALPFLQALGEKDLADKLRDRLRIERTKARLAKNSNYYDEALILFGLGYVDGQYRFDDQGRVLPRWAAHPPP